MPSFSGWPPAASPARPSGASFRGCSPVSIRRGRSPVPRSTHGSPALGWRPRPTPIPSTLPASSTVRATSSSWAVVRCGGCGRSTTACTNGLPRSWSDMFRRAGSCGDRAGPDCSWTGIGLPWAPMWWFAWSCRKGSRPCLPTAASWRRMGRCCGCRSWLNATGPACSRALLSPAAMDPGASTSICPAHAGRRCRVASRHVCRIANSSDRGSTVACSNRLPRSRAALPASSPRSHGLPPTRRRWPPASRIGRVANTRRDHPTARSSDGSTASCWRWAPRCSAANGFCAGS